jgi:membrane-associated phospholipid phosphatase
MRMARSDFLTMTPDTHTRPGLRSAGLFARWPILGWTMFLLGSLTLGALMYFLRTNEALPQWDLSVAKTFRAAQVNAPWSWMENMLFAYFLGREVVVIIGMILVLYFFQQRYWRELAMVVIGLGGGALLWGLLSHFVDRPRPADPLDVLPLSGPSFPSAPAVMAVLCYGLLAYLLIPNLPSHFWKWLVALLGALAIASIGLSSLLFGIHYATDVIAGSALGLAWAGLVYMLAERMIPAGNVGRLERVQKAGEFHGLRVPRLFKQRPMLGSLVIVLASLSFAVIGYNVLAEGTLVQLDQSIYSDLLAIARAAPPSVNDLMLFGFFIGKQAVQCIVLLLSLYFLSQRYWLEFAILQISTQGGGLLKTLIIDSFARPRPPDQLGFVTTTLASFPSGHALGTIICYGFLAYVLVPKMPSPFWKWMLSLGIFLLVLFEGFSRIFHGNHYLTDVLAAFALGIAWLVFVCTVMEAMFARARGQRE